MTAAIVTSLAVGMGIGWSLALVWATRPPRPSKLDLSFKRAKERDEQG